MNKNIKKNLPFMNWLIEVAEEKIIEHKLLKKIFDSNEEFIIFTIIWLRVYKDLYLKIKDLDLNCINTLTYDQYIKEYYSNQKNKYLGMTINGVTRECEIPRSTVKRTIEKLIKKGMLNRNKNILIIPTNNVRDIMKAYRQYIFQSNKRIYSLFENLNLKNQNNKKDNL